MSSVPTTGTAAASLERLSQQMDRALAELAAAKPFAKANHQPWAFDLALRLMQMPGGVEVLYGMAPRFDPAGLFHGGDWASPAILQSRYVANTLHSGVPQMVSLECLSELRLLAIALGDAEHPDVPPESAQSFLEDVLAHNIDLLFPGHSEESRVRSRSTREAIHAVFGFVADRLGLEGVVASLVDEAERVLRQRPIRLGRVVDLIETAARSVRGAGPPEASARAEALFAALHGPTELSRRSQSPEDYERAAAGLSDTGLTTEAEIFARSMHDTGIVCPYHALLLRAMVDRSIDTIASALALGEVGRSSLDAHGPLVRRLIDTAIYPATAQAVYGLARMLERGVLYFHPTRPGLRRLIDLRILPDVAAAIERTVDGELPANAVLVAATIQVLGQPLGIGQGDNPTCQAARAISLWSQSDTGYLLETIARAARDGEITMHFEGQPLKSSDLDPGLVDTLHTELDPVSLLLVPHLDKIYAEMSRLVDDRADDGHKWINPAYHGWWVHRGFAAAVGETTGVVHDFDGFIRRFYASYHPLYNGGREVVYPQPAGIAITDLWAALVGWHAVSIQRVEPDPYGELRVYFYNPNDDGGQQWGQGIVTSTSGCGEEPGESSLPFHQYASRTYVFHYNPRELGDPAAVPDEDVATVRELARHSWAAALPWDDEG